MPLIAKIVVLFTLAFGSARAWAIDAAQVKALECWIYPDNDRFQSEHIRCLHQSATQESASAETDPADEALLEQLRELLRHGRLETLNAFFKDRIERLGLGAVSSVRLGAYPSPWSWEEEMPQQLVRSLFCPKGVSCAVSIRRD